LPDFKGFYPEEEGLRIKKTKTKGINPEVKE